MVQLVQCDSTTGTSVHHPDTSGDGHQVTLQDYIIICSNEEEGKSHIISKLQFYQRPYSTLPSDASFADYLIRHFRRWPEAKMRPRRAGVASVVDPDK